jgi:inhibitor of cysteine peptidase
MTIDLKASDAGTRPRLDVGDRATLRLAENPTTGFRWTIEFDDSRVRLVEDTFEGPGEPAGAGGERVLVFEALRSGPAPLNLTNKRAWESAEPVDTFAVELDVQP